MLSLQTTYLACRHYKCYSIAAKTGLVMQLHSATTTEATKLQSSLHSLVPVICFGLCTQGFIVVYIG